ncbi:MAG: hypothetical protein NC935_02575 [Candidatus Omnitrophica bacterium]|nr:hypothetical protein [Candidatus Omnitrophota bacterium]
MRKILFFILCIILFSSCATIKHTSEGFGRGVSQDIQGVGKALKNIDNWINEYSW